MDMSTFKTMQEAAAAIGSATKYIGAANLELGKVALPAVRSAVGNVPKAVEKTLDQARSPRRSPFAPPPRSSMTRPATVFPSRGSPAA